MDAHLGHSLFILNEDVLYHILTYLDRKSLANLAQTCKAMIDLLYIRAALWMETVPVLCLLDASEDTARSIKERSITTVILNADFFNEEVIDYCEALESITTLILSNKVLDRFSVIRPDYCYETTVCCSPCRYIQREN